MRPILLLLTFLAIIPPAYADSSSYRGALQVSEDDKIVSYFVTKGYKSKVAQGHQIASQALSQQASDSITNVDVRGLKLMSSYEDSLRFAKKEQNVCQSVISNFYSVHRILTHNRDYRVQAPHDKVSQYVFSCSGSDTASLENVNLYFTPVGRLYNIAGNIRSSENEVEIVETFKKKHAGKNVVFECYRYKGNKCSSGEAYYKDKYVHLKLSFDTSRGDFKSFKNGQYSYLYQIELVSKHLLNSDINSLRQVLEAGNSKTETKF